MIRMATNSERLTIMEQDIKYIRENLSTNSEEHKAIIDALNNFKLQVETELKHKADKSYVEKISNRIWVFTGSLIGVLLTILGAVLSFIFLK